VSSRCSIVAFFLLAAAPGLGAQGPGTGTTLSPSAPHYETRALLEEQARAAEVGGRTSEAFVLRSRLKSGDFQEGDKIVIQFEMTGKTDTVQVRAGKLLQFPGMSDLSLDGVLRSELTDTLKNHVSRYLRNPNLRAVPLLPVAVLGEVRAPGFYYTAADVVLRDVLMNAGGLSLTADIDKTVIRRGQQEIWNARDVRVAMADGLSLDRLSLRAGDEIYVPQQVHRRLGSTFSIISTSLAVALGVLRLLH